MSERAINLHDMAIRTSPLRGGLHTNFQLSGNGLANLRNEMRDLGFDVNDTIYQAIHGRGGSGS